MKLILKSELRQEGWSGCAGGGGPVAQLLRRHEKQIKVNSPISFCGNKVEKIEQQKTENRRKRSQQNNCISWPNKACLDGDGVAKRE